MTLDIQVAQKRFSADVPPNSSTGIYPSLGITPPGLGRAQRLKALHSCFRRNDMGRE